MQSVNLQHIKDTMRLAKSTGERLINKPDKLNTILMRGVLNWLHHTVIPTKVGTAYELQQTLKFISSNL